MDRKEGIAVRLTDDCTFYNERRTLFNLHL